MTDITYENLKNDKTVIEVRPQLFLCNQLKTVGKTKDDDVYYTIEDIIKMWGYHEHFNAMLDRLQRFITVNPNILITVHYDIGGFNRDIESQKLLGWSMWYMDTQKFGLVGGILFQNNKMSFHT